jgi:hypothetical protein
MNQRVGLGILLFSMVSFSQASGTKKVGEVPESTDSYRDPGFYNPTNSAATNSLNSSVLNFKGNRAPGLPETLKPEERPNFPNFKPGTNGTMILYGTDRNGKQFEKVVSRENFDKMRKEFEASEAKKAEATVPKDHSK